MAPIGGGPPAGFTQAAAGTGTGLNYVGNHCYANSGNIEVPSGTTVALFQFTTGSQYINATITGGRDMKAGAETTTEILFDSQIVFSSKYENGTGQTLVPPYNTNIFILIPPHTSFTLQCSPEDANETISMTLVGEVY